MIGRVLRAHARAFAGDVVLLWVAVAGVVISLSVVANVPPEFADAPPDVRAALMAPFATVLATYGAVLAAVYGSFRYTVDRRDGVIAQRLMSQRRGATYLARAFGAAVGGAVVALAAAAGGHAALRLAGEALPLDWSSVAQTCVLGAASGLWGMGLGVIVQTHLVALFVVPMSLSGAVLLAIVWRDGAVYLPFLAMLEALRFDLSAVGIVPDDRLGGPIAALVAGGWVLAAVVAGGVSFVTRDVT